MLTSSTLSAADKTVPGYSRLSRQGNRQRGRGQGGGHPRLVQLSAWDRVQWRLKLQQSQPHLSGDETMSRCLEAAYSEYLPDADLEGKI